MRKECKKQKQITIAGVQGYHGGSGQITNNYAFRGFTGNWYFNSDRKEELAEVGGQIVRAKNGQPLQGYGLELEVECKGIRNQTVLAECCEKIIFPVFKFGADMFKMQNDSSLGGETNVEIITQVMTKSRIRNDYAAYKAMFQKYFPSFGITADSKLTKCGMHVNVSNALFGSTEAKQADNIRKLFYIVNRHYDFMLRLLYRDPHKTTWCGRMDYSNAKNLDLYSASSSHGNCMNLSHFREGRIEIRLVGGQKDYFCFLNTMESIFHMVERVRSLKWSELDSLSNIFQGCNQYVYKRIDTECSAFIDSVEKMKIANSVVEEDLDIQH